ncbi:hypothetical protein [Alkalihalobacillus sp. TS-13]|uniref:hypothetical protein n=1 Tax=Alkalihalobacillus sp. TS-13 TaxID=2842455 RepID=UPI001C86EF8D|nr:hypothetical protein [Alkalihalobacillus sp. TS-13]
MNILTNTVGTELEQINKALDMEGLPQLKTVSEITSLGEGAWHYAYLVNSSAEPLVLRLPKKIAYDKEVGFNYDELMSDYAGTHAYYQHANKAKEGICPKYFTFFVSEELTYTIESYVGTSVGLGVQTNDQSRRYGIELGEFFSAIEKLESPLSGLGYLKWSNGCLSGELDMDIHSFIPQETEEYSEELETLLESDYEFDKKRVRHLGDELIPKRSNEEERLIFTNQDTSPENMIFTQDRIHIIDPYPIIYTGPSLAANLVFNYQTTFPTFYNTKRYEKQRYNRHIEQLKKIADGFIEGYVQDSVEKRDSLQVEVFLKHVTMAYTHLQLLKKDTLNREQEIRYGLKSQIENRLEILIERLGKFPLEHKKAAE